MWRIFYRLNTTTYMHKQGGSTYPALNKNFMKSNTQIQAEVQDAIKYEPLLHAAEIGVTVKEGVVTLTGIVDSYAKKLEAEDAAKKVGGTKAIVDEIKVEIGKRDYVNDEDLARDVVEALDGHLLIPAESIVATVEDGWLTLEGVAGWDFEREAALKAVRHLNGVKGVVNNIKIRSEVSNIEKKESIEKALQRHWSIDSDNININVNGNNVVLTGYVCSIYEKEEAERIVLKTPGIWFVDNKLEVVFDSPYLC